MSTSTDHETCPTVEFIDGVAVLQEHMLGERRYLHLLSRIGIKATSVLELRRSMDHEFGAIDYRPSGSIADFDMDWVESSVETIADMEKETGELLALIRGLRVNLELVFQEGRAHNRKLESAKAIRRTKKGQPDRSS